MQSSLIVGASRGLGLELTQELLRRGRSVTAVTRGENAALSAVQAQYPERLVTLTGDVREQDSLVRAAGSLPVCARFDQLIYNAAIHLEQDRRDIEQASTKDILTTLDVNAVGAARAVQAFRRLLTPRGQLVLVSSEAGSIGGAERTSEYGYCMSKAAMNMFGKLLLRREQERGEDIDVVCMHPGWLRTDMGGPHAHLAPEDAARDLLDTLSRRRQEGGAPFVDRLGEPMAW